MVIHAALSTTALALIYVLMGYVRLALVGRGVEGPRQLSTSQALHSLARGLGW